MAVKCFLFYLNIQHTAVVIILFLAFVGVVCAMPIWVRKAPLGDSGTFPLILISFDGFRWDYLQRTNTPNFDKFLQNGVTARFGLRNAFVTKTFPNHMTLASGLWEESHGIIANSMYDPVLNQTFTTSNVSAQEDPAWFDVGAEPIWVTNQLQTVNGRSGVIMWVGGGASIKYVKPSRYVAYNRNTKNETKVDMLVDWLTDKYPINLGLVYFDQPDSFGHTYGPDSPQVTGMIAGLDDLVGYLLKQLQERGLLDNINIIITSDHGFTETPKGNMINLDHFINPDSYHSFHGTPIVNIWPEEGKEEEIYQNLTAAAEMSDNFTVYRREDIPAHFHYSNNRRISPIVAVADDTFSFCTGECIQTEKGNHGYDNRLQDMHPFFLAMGPSFKKNYSIDSFDNVDVYPLMCHLLGLVAAPNNGSLDTVYQLLAEEMEDSTIITLTFVFTVILISCVGGAFAVKVFKELGRIEGTQYIDYSSIAYNHSNGADSMEPNGSRPGPSMSSAAPDSKLPLLLAQESDDF